MYVVQDVCVGMCWDRYMFSKSPTAKNCLVREMVLYFIQNVSSSGEYERTSTSTCTIVLSPSKTFTHFSLKFSVEKDAFCKNRLWGSRLNSSLPPSLSLSLSLSLTLINSLFLHSWEIDAYSEEME